MEALDGFGSVGEPSAAREVEVEGVDRESLLVNWLNEILFLEQTYQLVCERFHIYEVNDYRLRVRPRAEVIIPSRYCQGTITPEETK